jgi:uncharacterized membrane protein
MQGLRLGGHPLHPALVHFPVACWTAAPALDAAFLLTQQPAWWQASFACIAVGVGVGLLAMCAGLLDLMALPVEHPAQATAQRHLLLVSSAWCLFAVSLLFRPLKAAPDAAQAWLALSLSLSGFLLLAFGAYAGARLVYEFGVGQNPRPPA